MEAVLDFYEDLHGVVLNDYETTPVSGSQGRGLLVSEMAKLSNAAGAPSAKERVVFRLQRMEKRMSIPWLK